MASGKGFGCAGPIIRRFSLLWMGLLLCVSFSSGCAHGNGSKPLCDSTAAALAAGLPPVPEAKRDAVKENLHGYEIRDPYRWMESEEKALPWAEAQNARTRNYLDSFQYPGLKEQVESFFSVGFISDPALGGSRLFYMKRDGENLEQPQLFVREGNEERILVDLNRIDPEFKTAVDWFVPSRDGRYLAYGLSKDGSENSTLHVLNVDNGTLLADRIPETRHSDVCWLPDNSGFYYTRYPAGDQYNRRAYFHKLGDDPKNDPLVFGEKRDKAHFTGLGLSDDARHLIVAEHHGWTETDLYLLERESGKLRPLVLDPGASIHAYHMAKGKIYILTNKDAPNFRIAAIDPKNPAPENWQTVVAEGDRPMEDFRIHGNALVIQTLANVANRLEIFDLSGKQTGMLTMPAVGMLTGVAGNWGTSRIAFVFNSFFYPPTLFTADLEKIGQGPEKTVEILAPIQPEDFQVRQVLYPSYDGTKVNLFIVHKKGLALDGETPTLLYGYGGFQVNMAPYFSRRVATWIERGGVYAVANIRGGGEFGERWHKAGMREKKFQVFEDFEYAARYLIREGYTKPARLVVEGGSNGGLLVGAMMTRSSELFAAAVGSVGLYDMVRYQRFPPAELWIPEYGSADRPEDTGYMLGYSPYHQVLPGVRYPAFFGHTADTDTRVHWLHTAKFVAELQADTAGKAPILMWLDRRAGHGAGKGKTDIIQEYYDKFRFMFSVVGDPAAVRKAAGK